MQTKKRLISLTRTGTRLVILAAILMTALISKVMPAAADTLPATTCTLAAGTRTCDLWAKAGSVTMPDSTSVPIWGYADTAGGAAQLPGPALIVNEGETVVVNLTNNLPAATAILFQGQALIPDRIGAPASGGTKSYTFTAGRPGTYMYGAGLLANAQHQAAMGLYGALIVRPATVGQAYNDPTTAYDDEALLVLSEIDPALNNRANPATFDMRKYAPKYFLINGQAYPDTAAIPTMAANRVLLRYLNAGMQFHSMALLGTHQTVIANDGSPLAHSHRMVAETFGPGQTVDTIATIPAAAVDGSKFAIYDGNMLLHNSSSAGLGGMLTFLTVSGTPPTGDTTGPVTSSVAYAAGTLTATIDDTARGGSTIFGAEYYLDSTSGSGTPMNAADGSFNSVSEGVTLAVAVPAGPHTLYVRGQDTAGNWGAFGSVLVNGGDVTGPATTGLTLVPNPTNGSVSVALHGTGNDSASGGSDVVAAEYTIDGGTAVAMNVNVAAPIASLDATIAAATVNGLSEASHVVTVRSQDAAGNWGAFTQIGLVVDKSGPTTSNVNAAPNPNNGQQPFNISTPAVRLSASLADTTSNISAGEGFIDTVGANGTGFVFAANDGVFNSLSEAGYADIPLATIAQLSNGNHTLYVHGKDVAGNWGPTSSTILVIDKSAPLVSAVNAAPNPTAGATSVTLAATATDGTAVTQAEWFTGADPGAGNGTAMTVSGSGPWNLSAAIDVSTWINGTYTLNVRARDAAGNWSAPSSTALVVNAPPPPFAGLYFSTLGNTAVPGVAAPFDDADIYSWNGTAFARLFDASVAGLPNAADVDGLFVVDADTFYMSFTAPVNPPGPLATVDDSDIVLYDAGVWSLYFDGSDVGLTTNGEDVNAFELLPDGSLLVSTIAGATVPGLGGTRASQDITRCVGTFGPTTTCTWSVYFDGSDVALTAGAENLDGVSTSAGNIYLSTAGNFSVSGLTGQGADVFSCNSPTTGTATACTSFSMYFDGSANSITDNLDAVDLQ